MKCTHIIRCFLFGFVSVYLAHAGESSETAARIDAGSERNSAVASLEKLVQEIDRKESEVSRIRQRIQVTPDSAADERSRKARDEIREQRLLFERLAVDVDISTFTEETDVKFDWQQQLGKLLKPIMVEVEFATRQSRAIALIFLVGIGWASFKKHYPNISKHYSL